MQVVLSVTLSRLYFVLGYFHMSTDTLLKSFLISNFVPLALNLHMKLHLRSG